MITKQRSGLPGLITGRTRVLYSIISPDNPEVDMWQDELLQRCIFKK